MYFQSPLQLFFLFDLVLCIAIGLSWDPTLARYATAVTWTVIVQMGVKLFGSFVFQLTRLSRAMLRRLCLRCCYRLELDPMEHPR